MAVHNTETSPSFPNTIFSNAPPTLVKSTACKIRNLYEIQKIQGTEIPSINPYEIFTKPSTSLLKSVKKLFNPSQKPKELIQVTRFHKHPIPSGEQTRIITLEFPHQFLQKCTAEGYNYVHVGGIRLGLTFHGRKGVPLATRIALHDTRHREYRHACLGMMETTLNSGTIAMTLFPNYTMFLQDKSIASAFRVQIQVVGASMDPGLHQATLHYQMAFRVQDDALGSVLPLPSYEDTPLIQVGSLSKPTVIRIPVNISKEELVSVLPQNWVASYENYRKEEEKSTTFRSRTINFKM